MALEDKLDQLIKVLSDVGPQIAEGLKAIQAAGGAPAAAPAKTTKATKTAAAEPAVKWVDVAAKFDELKTAGHTPALKKIIADQGHATLKALEGDPTKHEAALAALVAFEEGLTPTEVEDDL